MDRLTTIIDRLDRLFKIDVLRSSRGDACGPAKHDRVIAYLPNTAMSIMGVSHAASEQLVMETHMVPLFKSDFHVQAKTIRMEKWWR